MSKKVQSVFRSALQASPQRIAAMNDSDLNSLMRQLLAAQAYKCGSPLSELRVNTEDKAADNGSDAWSAAPAIKDDWLGSTDTCWQFKSGTAGEPKKLRGEINKALPKATLAAGGRVVIVASGSKAGKDGEDRRLKQLRHDAQAEGVPDTLIEVIGSERLTSWCNQHPAVAARWAGRPEGLWTFEDWASSDEHQTPWHESPEVTSELVARRADLDFATGSVVHLHIHGLPGVGKTRLALEMCRDAVWQQEVVYIPQAADERLVELIDGAATEEGVRLLVVADEAQPQELLPLRRAVGRGDGRVRLITIGHSPSPDPTRIPASVIRPLDARAMRAVVEAFYPSMPIEHAEFVVRFADGYVRLARLAADAVALDGTLDTRGLLGRDEVRAFFDRMLGSDDRRALYVVAVLASVGWTDDQQAEAEAVATHFKLSWNDVRATVERFHSRFGIAPRGGRYRYISPTPLGSHLAVEAWTTFPDLLKSLPDALPTEAAKDAYYERLRLIASNPQAREYAREELTRFFRAADFEAPRAARRWSALASADPARAASGLRRALSDATVDERRAIAGSARRELVWGLVRLAWPRGTFRDAATSLALLGEAENETFANNASSEFVHRFQIFLGGTAVPYVERLSVLDDLIVTRRAGILRVVIRALARIGDRQAFRYSAEPATDAVPEPEWQPQDGVEYRECIEAAIERLVSVAQLAIPEMGADLVQAAGELSMLLREAPVRTGVARFFEAVRTAYPDTREALRRHIADVQYHETKYWKELPADELSQLDELHASFEDASLGARVQQLVGSVKWDIEEQPDLTPIAVELVENQEALLKSWPWLTSGDAHDGWRLGEALATADPVARLAGALPVAAGAGRDFRVLCGYIMAQRRVRGDTWYDAWMVEQSLYRPKPLSLLFEVAWRCGATPAVAEILASAVREGPVPPDVVAQLAHGVWTAGLPVASVESLLRTLATHGHASTAISILAYRLRSGAAEFLEWETVALELATRPEPIRNGGMAGHYWKQTAQALVPRHAAVIADAIFREHASRSGRTWFIQRSEAAGILGACLERDPEGTWRALRPHLSDRARAHRFSIGLPNGLLERMPRDAVSAWLAEDPGERVVIALRLVGKNLASDDTLAARLIGDYGDRDEVASTFFSEYVSGGWMGSASSHWEELARGVERVASRTMLPKLREWAEKAAARLHEMAVRDRRREEEEELRER